MKRGLFRDLLHLYARCNDPDLRIRYIDEKKVAGEHVHIIRVMNLTGDFVDLHIDVESDRVIRKSYQGGAEVKLATLEEVYSDYQDFAGVMLPLITRVTANGKLFLFTRMLTAEFDLELSAETFVD